MEKNRWVDEIESLLKVLNREHGTSFHLAGQFEGGEQGAHAIVEPDGARCVLKRHHGVGYLEQFRRAQIATEHLAARHYPVPRYRFVGAVDETAYTIQSLLPGKPMGSLNASQLPELLKFIDLQVGPAPLPSRGWPQLIVHSILHGFDEYCVIETLRQYSPITAELLDRLQRLATDLADIDVATTDIVHFDFTPANILVADGEISGVIDWDGAVAGDRAFDLATLLFYANDQSELAQTLWREGAERSSADAMRLYLAHLIVRQVDWSIRFHSTSIADYWIHASLRLLHDFS